MPFVKTALAELGRTQSLNGESRAHVQCRNGSGGKVDICGPSRTTEERAQQDLTEICAAGAQGKTREEGLEMMRDEAQQLKNSAQYEAEIREILQRRDSMPDESEYEEDDMSENSEPVWMQEYTEDSPEQSSQSVRPTLSPIEATAELTRFRPIRATPSDLPPSVQQAAKQFFCGAFVLKHRASSQNCVLGSLKHKLHDFWAAC